MEPWKVPIDRLYFSSAKQSKTRKAQIKSWSPRILPDKGLDDE